METKHIVITTDPTTIMAVGNLGLPLYSSIFLIEPTIWQDAHLDRFADGCYDASIVITTELEARLIYQATVDELASEQRSLIDNDAECFIGVWKIGKDQAVIIAGDTGGNDFASYGLIDNAGPSARNIMHCDNEQLKKFFRKHQVNVSS